MIMLVIVLVLFGAKRIPEISGSLGKGIREFKRNMSDVESSIMNVHETPPVGRISPPLHSAAPSTADGMRDETRPEPKRLLVRDEETNR